MPSDATERLRILRIDTLMELREKLHQRSITSLHDLYHMLSGLNFAALTYQNVASALKLPEETVLLIMEGKSVQGEFEFVQLSRDMASYIDEQLTTPTYTK